MEGGRDLQFFPKAIEDDEELKEIMEDTQNVKEAVINKDFVDFDGVCIQTLLDISKKEALLQNKKFSKVAQNASFEESIMFRSTSLAEQLQKEVSSILISHM